MERIPLETQTLYAELMEQLAALDAHRTIGRLSGCFITKVIKGEIYYYFQYSGPGGVSRQVYVGKKGPVLDRVVDKFLSEREEYKEDLGNIRRLCAQLRAGGALTTDSGSARVLKSFSECGLFQMKAVLVGTHAFSVIGNLLGVRWKGASLRTGDVDIAGARTMNIAIPKSGADVPRVLEQLEMGFLPVPSLNPKAPSTSFKVRGKPLRVDFLTPASAREERDPVFIPRFRVAAQPLPYLEYLIENPELGAVVNGGGFLVNVPSPARFAFHKLIVTQERYITAQSKTEKDFLQASQIFSFIAEERPGDILLAWDGIKSRGRSWTKRINTGLSIMKRHHRKEHDQVAALLE